MRFQLMIFWLSSVILLFFFCHATAQPVQISGQFVEISDYPDPAQSDYPDCYITARMKIEKASSPMPSEIIVIYPCFLNRKYTQFQFKLHQRVIATLVPFSELSSKQQSIQQADSIFNFELDRYFMKEFRTVSDISPKPAPSNGPDAPAKEYISGFSRPLNPPLPLAMVVAREQAIHDDILTVKKKLAALPPLDEINTEFQKKWTALDKSRWAKVKNQYIFARLNGGFYTLPLKYQFQHKESISRNIEALKHLNQYFSFHNIQFIVVVLPDHNAVSARKFLPEYAATPDIASLGVVAALLDNGIEAIDPMEEILKLAEEHEFSYVYPNDHPGWGCQLAVARLVVERLKRMTDPYTAISMTWKQPEKGWCGDNFLFPGGTDTAPHQPGTAYTFPVLNLDGKPFASKPDAPVLVWGNSFIQTPMVHSSLAAAISGLSGYAIHEFRMDGNGPAGSIPLELLLHREKYLKNKKICVLSYPAKMFSQWQFTDVVQQDRQRMLLNGRTRLLVLEPENNGNPSFEHPLKKKMWDPFLMKNPGVVQCLLPKANQEVPIFERTLELRKDDIIVLRAATFPRQNVIFNINGVNVNAVEEQYHPRLQLLPAVISAAVQELKITASCRQENAIIAVRAVEVWRKPDFFDGKMQSEP